MKNFFKKYLADIILIVVLLSCALTAFLVLNNSGKKEHVIATIKKESEVVMTIDLSLESDLRSFEIEGKFTPLTIEVKHNSIRVSESGCPHKDCVYTGWVIDGNKPIICAYNLVEITFNDGYDVVI